MKKKKKDEMKPSVPLPGFENLIKTDEMLASEYLSRIIDKGFISRHRVYLENYINSDIAIALGQVKNSYKKYVLEGNWSEEKYTEVLETIISKFWILSSNAFLKIGADYDNGNLNKSKQTSTPNNNKSSNAKSFTAINDDKEILDFLDNLFKEE